MLINPQYMHPPHLHAYMSTNMSAKRNTSTRCIYRCLSLQSVSACTDVVDIHLTELQKVTLHDLRLNGIVGDEMGLGKTALSIAMMCWVKENSFSCGNTAIGTTNRGACDGHDEDEEKDNHAVKFLVVSPLSVAQNWQSMLVKPSGVHCMYGCQGPR